MPFINTSAFAENKYNAILPENIFTEFKCFIIILIDFQNSPIYIQHFINQLLRNLKYFYYIFINNIVIFSNIFENHYQYLVKIFMFFREKNISINLDKSFISYLLIEFLNFYIDNLKLYILSFYIIIIYTPCRLLAYSTSALSTSYGKPLINKTHTLCI